MSANKQLCSRQAKYDPLQYDQNICVSIVEAAKDFAFSKGIVMRIPDMPSDACVPIPFCLVPSPLPNKYFSLVKAIQEDINYVIHQVANDRQFLYNSLQSTIQVDEFTANLFKIYETVCKEGVTQPLSLGLLRSDYMLDTNDEKRIVGIKQIENNTIASSFGGMSPRIRDLHMFVLNKLGLKNYEERIFDICGSSISTVKFVRTNEAIAPCFAALTKKVLPQNDATNKLAKGIVSSWEAYGKTDSIVLFLVENVTYNICDQRALEFAILDQKKEIVVMRCTFTDLKKQGTLRENNCFFVNEKEVAVVYFRYGYTPDQYETQDWDLRLLIELSCAIKCPSVAYHLAGTKKVQLELAKPGILEKYLTDKESVERVRQVFAAQYDLDMNDEGDKAVALGVENPHCYVMKPEREGGGNNIYGENVRHLLKSIGSEEARQAYILMERINPPAVANCIVQRNTTPRVSQVVCELGIFGVILGTKDQILLNYEAGHLIRSKNIDSDEGGIAAGFGALDSPYLT